MSSIASAVVSGVDVQQCTITMILSRSAQYALRIMAYFALHTGDAPLRAKDIAEQVNIPAFYLSKILRRMVTAKL